MSSKRLRQHPTRVRQHPRRVFVPCQILLGWGRGAAFRCTGPYALSQSSPRRNCRIIITMWSGVVWTVLLTVDQLVPFLNGAIALIGFGLVAALSLLRPPYWW